MNDPYAPPPLPPPALPQLWPQPWIPAVTDDERTMALLAHLLGIFTGFLGPLIVFLVKKDSSPFVNHHGREALNFQITLMLVLFALGAVTFVTLFFVIGFALIPVIFVVQILAVVAEIMAAIAASKGEWYRYPFNMRLV